MFVPLVYKYDRNLHLVAILTWRLGKLVSLKSSRRNEFSINQFTAKNRVHSIVLDSNQSNRVNVTFNVSSTMKRLFAASSL